jgi:hypothetical protein
MSGNGQTGTDLQSLVAVGNSDVFAIVLGMKFASRQQLLTVGRDIGKQRFRSGELPILQCTYPGSIFL